MRKVVQHDEPKKTTDEKQESLRKRFRNAGRSSAANRKLDMNDVKGKGD